MTQTHTYCVVDRRNNTTTLIVKLPLTEFFKLDSHLRISPFSDDDDDMHKRRDKSSPLASASDKAPYIHSISPSVIHSKSELSVPMGRLQTIVITDPGFCSKRSSPRCRSFRLLLDAVDEHQLRGHRTHVLITQSVRTRLNTS